jgi:hypothetical protein
LRKKWACRQDKENNQLEILRQEIDKTFGSQCLLCGFDNIKCRLMMHNINFIRHRDIKNARTRARYYLKNQEYYIRICYTCHRILHFFEGRPELIKLLPLEHPLEPVIKYLL